MRVRTFSHHYRYMTLSLYDIDIEYGSTTQSEVIGRTMRGTRYTFAAMEKS